MKTTLILLSTFLLIFLCNIAMSQDAIPVRVYVQAYGSCQTVGEGGTVTVSDDVTGKTYFSGTTGDAGYVQGTVPPGGVTVHVYVTYGGHYGELCDQYITSSTTLYVCCSDVSCFAK